MFKVESRKIPAFKFEGARSEKQLHLDTSVAAIIFPKEFQCVSVLKYKEESCFFIINRSNKSIVSIPDFSNCLKKLFRLFLIINSILELANIFSE
jgi:hypothetical protein